MSKCKVCQSQLRPDIDKQILSGCNFSYLAGWCKERNFKVTSQTLKRHAKAHIPEYNSTKESNLSNQTEITITEKGENNQLNPHIISFEAYCHSIGLEPNDFKDLEQNFDKIIYGSQKALSLLFFKCTAIVDFKLSEHLLNQSSFPLEQIRGLRSIFEMYAKITGIENVINENSAIKTLESMGYTISKE